jgi:hypothetical protein
MLLVELSRFAMTLSCLKPFNTPPQTGPHITAALLSFSPSSSIFFLSTVLLLYDYICSGGGIC